MKISVNGSISNAEQAVISVYDHGLLYGIGLFETMRTYGGRPFLLSSHLERLRAGCSELDIRYKIDEDYLIAQIQTLLEVNQLQDAYIRLSISAGSELLGLPQKAYSEPVEIIYIKPLERQDHIYEAGKSLQLLDIRRNSPEGHVRLKSFHYMNNILGKRELSRYPWAAGAEGLLLTEQGLLAEGIVSNLFFMSHGECCTPSINTGILPGITREFVIDLARQMGIAVHEGFFRWEDLLKADEVFITNSIQEIVPITMLWDTDGKAVRVGQGTSGPVSIELLKRYRELTKG
ncbi:MAG: 4-amino-4-deoxychorismate lyase [Paenibacillus sp. RIFOXYA1_FULL_44_5]|nr:MAG: 4-amino-4-deoxychorismate lyase [Paenibacillus sp. RIFOXYA1_FULL_44_5]